MEQTLVKSLINLSILHAGITQGYPLIDLSEERLQVQSNLELKPKIERPRKSSISLSKEKILEEAECYPIRAI